MQKAEPDWDSLGRIALGWLEEAYSRVQKSLPGMNGDESKVGFMSTCCLLAAHEYLAAALDAFRAGRPFAGLASCRTVVEIGFIFLWCTNRREEAQTRVRRWARKSLSEDQRFLDELAKTSHFADDPTALQSSRQAVAEAIINTGVTKEMPNLKQMLKEIENELQGAVQVTDAYPTLYQFLCSSTHAGLCPDRYFRDDNGCFRRIERPEAPPVTSWIILTAAFHIAAGVFRFFNWDFSPLKAEYQTAIPSASPRPEA
jgi:hypothetical protein